MIEIFKSNRKYYCKEYETSCIINEVLNSDNQMATISHNANDLKDSHPPKEICQDLIRKLDYMFSCYSQSIIANI